MMIYNKAYYVDSVIKGTISFKIILAVNSVEMGAKYVIIVVHV